MNRYKRILVGLGLDARDAAIIRYASLIARVVRPEQVTFMHAVRAPMPDRDPYTGGVTKLDVSVPKLQAELEEAVRTFFDAPSDVQVHHQIEEEVPLDAMLDYTRILEVDLVVVGQGTRSGTLSERLARKAPCSVLVVPSREPEAIDRVLVPVDFSEHAADAAEVAAAFAEAAGLDEVDLLHVYGVPARGDRHQDTSTYALRQRAEGALEAFASTLNLRGLKPVPHFVLETDVPKAIDKAVRQCDADLVVIGARGRTPGAAILMGSVAEALVREVSVPLVAIKRKGVTLKLLDALLERSKGHASV